MATIQNRTEAHLTLPLMGVREKPVVKRTVVDGAIVEEVSSEQFPVSVKDLVVPPTLSASEQGEITVTKAQVTELRKHPTFVAWEENETLRVYD